MYLLKYFIVLCLTISFVSTTFGESSNVSEIFPKIKKSSEEQLLPHIGLKLGFNSPEGNYHSEPTWGLDVAFQPIIPFSIGFDFISENIQGKGNTENIARISLRAKAHYSMGGGVPILNQSYFGLGLGPMWENGTAYLGGDVFLGADFPIIESASTKNTMSLGGQVAYSVTSSENPDSLAVNGVIKYWF